MVEIVLRGPAKNALGTQLMQQLRDELRAADGRPVLITGDGDSFSAGLNLKELMGLDAAAMEGFLALLGGVLSDLFHYPGPTVACVNGHAIAGGALVALACDVRVAADAPKARIGLNEVALGLRFPPGILQLVRYRVPMPHAERVLLGGALYTPAQAAAVGLVDEVAADATAAARAHLAALSALPSDAYADTKRALRGHVEVFGAADASFRDQVLPAWTSESLRQRIRALLTK